MIPKDKIDKAKKILKILEINQKIKSFGTAFIAKKIDDVEEEIGSLTKIVTDYIESVPFPQDGIDGVQGEKGEKGDRGEQGLHGMKGDKGDKGERGEKGEKGEDGFGIDGKDGKNGIDGKDGSPDTPKQVKEKLLKVGLDYNELDNTPDINKVINIAVAGVRQSSKTVSLTELDDVDYSGLTQTNGKYVLGGTEYFESVSKNIKSYPYEFTYTGGGDIDYITYDLGGGQSIIKTFNYTSGDITSIVLSGDTPGGISLTKTLSYMSGNIDNIVYT